MNKHRLFCATILSVSIFLLSLIIFKTLSPLVFAICITIVFIGHAPKHLLSPRNFLFGFYFLWYGPAIYFAQRYENYHFQTAAELKAYVMLYSCFLIFFWCLTYFENRKATEDKSFKAVASKFYFRADRLAIFSLFGASLAVLYVIFGHQEGYRIWLSSPGMAFLTRQGNGLATICLIFFSSLACASTAYYAYKTKKYTLFIFCAIFQLLLVPFLGSKGRIFMQYIFMLLPWFFFARLFSRNFFYSSFLFGMSFFVGLALRKFNDEDFSSISKALTYSFNYFDTYKNLVISLNDFNPGFLNTFLMPFNKFFTPFGLSEKVPFYDMSAWLTSIYIPEDWAMRATTQWPIETDLYMSFYFVFGFIFIYLMSGFIGLFYNKAVSTRQFSYMFVSIYICFEFIGHLRGGIIYWTDFYLFPMVGTLYFILNRVRIDEDDDGRIYPP